jgi:hypothetical protein
LVSLQKNQTALSFAYQNSILISDFIRFNGDVFDLSAPLPKGFELVVVS